jgi:hypothetical protein
MPTCYLPLPALTAPEEAFAGMTRVGDAELLIGCRLFIGEVELAQRGIGFAEIFPHLRMSSATELRQWPMPSPVRPSSAWPSRDN